MTAVFLACGNPSRGDDGLGLLLLERAESLLAEIVRNEGDRQLPRVTFVADYQFQIEHAEDLRERSPVLFLDADASCASPYSFRRAVACRDESFTTHELSPGAVLHVYHLITGETPPPAFVLSVRGEHYELGEGLSEQAQVNLELATRFLRGLLEDLNESSWAMQVGDSEKGQVSRESMG